MALIDKASLLMVPSTYEDGTLYNVLPSGNKAPDETGNHNGYDQTRADFTFSRGSNLAATRVNSDGLIEKGRENLLLQSNQFDTTWSGSISVASGYAGYDGTNDAWLLSKGAGQYLSLVSGSLSNSGVQTYSIYCKAATLDLVTLFVSYSGGNKYVEFDLTDGSVNAQTSSGIIDSGSTSLGNGWYRLYMTINQSVTGVRVYPDWTNSVAGGVYIQNAQLEKGLVSTPYIATGSSTAQAGILEDMPRINYDANGENGALLLEPQRSNLFTNSEYIEGSSWSQDIANFTRVSNQGTSPEGLNNATKITPTIAGSLYWYQNNSVTSGTIYSNSIFAKADGFNVLQITGSTGMTSGVHNFDLSNGTHSGDYSSAFIEPYGNGWYRCGISEAATSTSSGARFLFAIVPNVESARLESVTPNGTDGILVYGAQFEAGSYSSSIIPTHGAAVTRGAESCSTIVSQLTGTGYTATLYIEFDGPLEPSATDLFKWQPSADVSTRFWIYTTAAGIAGGGAYAFNKNNAKHKFIFRVSDSTTRSIFYNGTKVVNTTGVAAGSGYDLINIADANALQSFNVSEIIGFNEALSDAECVTLTTL